MTNFLEDGQTDSSDFKSVKCKTEVNKWNQDPKLTLVPKLSLIDEETKKSEF